MDLAQVRVDIISSFPVGLSPEFWYGSVVPMQRIQGYRTSDQCLAKYWTYCG